MNEILFRPILLSIVFVAGCDSGTSGLDPAERGALPYAVPEDEKLDTAKRHIQTCLDSWKSGVSEAKFSSNHPQLGFTAIDDILLQNKLVKFELGAPLPKSWTYEIKSQVTEV